MSQIQQDYRELCDKGVRAFKENNLEQARTYFLSASALDPQQKRAWLALAKLETDAEKRTDYYRKVVKIDPQDPIAKAYLDGVRSATSVSSPVKNSITLPKWLPLLVIPLFVLVCGGVFLLNQGMQTTAALPTQMITETPAPSLTVDASLLSQSEQAQASPTLEVTLEEQVTSTEVMLSPMFSETTPLDTVVFVIASPSATIDGNNLSNVIQPTVIPVQPTQIPPTANFVVTFVIPPTQPAPIVTSAPVVTFAVTTNTPTQFPTALFSNSTTIPLFATPTLTYLDNLNTEIAPTLVPSTIEPNSGSGIRER